MSMHSRVFPTFSSIRFIVSGFMLRSLIPLNLSFFKSDKDGLICILLHADHQLDQYHWKILSFFDCMVYVFCQRSSVTRCMRLFQGHLFYSIDLPACLCIVLLYSLMLGLVIHSKVILLFRISLAILGFLFFSHEIENCSFNICKNCFAILMGIALNLWLIFGKLAIFTMLILPSH